MADNRLQRVLTERRALRERASQRWVGFQPPHAAPAVGIPNRDGTHPAPRYAAPTAEQLRRYGKREKNRELFFSTAHRGARIAAERKIGTTLDFSDLPPSEQAQAAGRPVARIVQLGTRGVEPEGFATGFLVHHELLLTNWHVFRTPDEADGVGAQFLYERVKDGIRSGLVFEIDRKRFFLSDRELDFALVAVKPRSLTQAALAQFGFLPLISAKGKILKGDPVNIIQHPDGRPKQYATVNNRLLDLRDDGYLLYETDTLEGSSGSPVFNRHWEAIGLHHSGVPRMDGDRMVLRDGRRVPLDAEVSDDEVDWIANEGIRTSAIVDSLKRQRLGDSAQARRLADMLATTDDPVALVELEAPAVPAARPSATPAAAIDPLLPPIQIEVTRPVTIHVGTVNVSSAVAGPLSASGGTRLPNSGRDFREKSLRFDENYGSRALWGYKSRFLAGWMIGAPGLTRKRATELDVLKNEAGKPWVIPYYHYSLLMSRARRLVVWTAANVDYSDAARRLTRTRKEYGGENWRLDPRVALGEPDMQIDDNSFYAPARKIDRGHVVRREDTCWGSTANEAQFGNSDTYHYTNCTPQHESFNQSQLDGLWGKFENHIQKQVRALDGRMVVLAGPVLSDDDPTHGYPGEKPIQVPMRYWKVVLCTSRSGDRTLRHAYGFVFDQSVVVRTLGYEKMNMHDFEIHQVPIAQISRETGVTFAASVLAADVLKNGARETRRGTARKRITGLESLVLGTGSTGTIRKKARQHG
jgi:endonuclease G